MRKWRYRIPIGGITKKWAYRLLLIVLVLAGSVYGAVAFVRSLSCETTDDAYVTGTIVPVAPEVRGRVVKVFINDNQKVAAGDPLVEIFRDDYVNTLQERKEIIARLHAEYQELQAAVEQKRKTLSQARANVNAAIAEEALARNEVKRYERLAKQDIISPSQFDRIESQWRVAAAKREAAEAAVAAAAAALESTQARLNTQRFKIRETEASRQMAELDLSRTTLTAPVSGRVAMKRVDPGKYVQPGQALLSIVQEETWVVANFKETQIKKMTVGQPVEIRVDAYPGKVFKGHVDSLQTGTGAVFSLLPPENATGNFVKVVQRVPVKIVLDSPPDPRHPLLPGLSVIPSVDVSKPTGPKLS
ncbi:MAG: HlyD family secretion protein [Syntrophobacterales bacterium]|nr:HlyD family secretion protein [Syntrophobacterales bacterium]